MKLTRTEPMAHQASVVEASKDSPYFGLFMEQGTGKTFCTIATATHLYLSGKIDTVLVLAPNGVHDNWAINELPTHMREDVAAQLSVAVWHSADGIKARNVFEHTIKVKEPNTFLWVFANIEALRVKTFTQLVSGLNLARTLMVIDESTIIKNPKAQVTKAAIDLGDKCAYRRILTGTPMSQGPLDLWAQSRFLSPDALPYKSWTAFKYQFAVEEVINLGPNRPSFVKITGYRNQGELAQLIKRFSHRVLKSECLDLPEKVYETRYVELTPEQRKAYTGLVEKAFTSLPNDGVVTVTSAIALILRLQQVALGYAPDETNELVAIPSNRLATLADIMNETTGKGIIFCRFKEDVRRVMDLLNTRGERGVEYSGNISEIYRISAVDMFQNDPEVRWFVATSAASRGLTLTAAETVIYYSQDYRLETRLQSEDRAHRIGQKKTVTYLDIVARKTVDQQIIAALRKKKDLADEIVDARALRRMLEL